MNCYHLRKSEVAYELKIRGQPATGTADELRKRLNQCLMNNTAIVEKVINNMDVVKELTECEVTIADIEKMVDNYEGNGKDNEYNRLLARLNHLDKRIERIPMLLLQDDESQQTKDALLKRTRDAVNALSQERQEDVPKGDRKVIEDNDQHQEDLSILETKGAIAPTVAPQQIQTQPLIDLRPPDQEFSVPARSKPNGCSSQATVRSNSVPVYKWGLKYDPESSQSVGSFLQRVEELRRARGVSQLELFDAAVDLFSGQALVWYRSVQRRVKTWEELCKEMRIVFQSPDYDIRLQREIFNRIQGEHEPIDVFIAAMEGLYTRLAEPVPESTQLAQILNNIHPHLQDRLSLCEVRTLEELRQMGRRAEAGRFRAECSRQQPRSGNFLEPDLAYVESGKKRVAPSARVAAVSNHPSKTTGNLVCWNCSEAGHRFSACPKERRRFCYGCGKADTVKTKCPTCSPKNV